MPDLSSLQLIIYAAAAFGAAILSGIAGGGAGFINTPLLIFFGLSPAQAVATGKLTGLSLSVGSLGGLQSIPKKSKKELVAIMALAFVIGLAAPFVITNLDSAVYRRLLGILLLAMIPVLLFKKIGQVEQKSSRLKTISGYLLLVVALCMQAVFSGGMGTLVNIVLMAFLGMSALEANVTKRYSQVILNVVIVLGVLFSSLIIWPIALVGICSALSGGYIGGKLAVKRGNSFVIGVFCVLMFVSAVGLLAGW